MKASSSRTEPRGTPQSPMVPWNCGTALDEGKRPVFSWNSSSATACPRFLDDQARLQYGVRRLIFSSVFKRIDAAGLWHGRWRESAERHFPQGTILMFPHHAPPPPHLYSTHAVSQCRLLNAWPICLMQMRLRRGVLRYQSQPCNHRKWHAGVPSLLRRLAVILDCCGGEIKAWHILASSHVTATYSNGRWGSQRDGSSIISEFVLTFWTFF